MPVEKTMRGLEDLTPNYEDGGRVALCGDVSGHEFHGNQYTAGQAAEHATKVGDHLKASQYHDYMAGVAARRGDKKGAKLHADAADAHTDAARGQRTSDASDKATEASKAAHAADAEGRTGGGKPGGRDGIAAEKAARDKAREASKKAHAVE